MTKLEGNQSQNGTKGEKERSCASGRFKRDGHFDQSGWPMTTVDRLFETVMEPIVSGNLVTKLYGEKTQVFTGSIERSRASKFTTP